jgi:hypothetical protein
MYVLLYCGVCTGVRLLPPGKNPTAVRNNNNIFLKLSSFCKRILRKNARNEYFQNRVELGYNVMKGTEYFVSLQTNVVITEEYNIMVNSEELIGTTEYLTL